MKKALIIANMLFASATVFGMQSDRIEQNQNDSVLRAVQTDDIREVKHQVRLLLDSERDYFLTLLIAYKNRQSWERNSFEEYVNRRQSTLEEVVNYEDAEGNFPLIVAARRNNLDIVKYLIRYGANVDKRTNGESIWRYALDDVRISQYLRNDLGMLDEAERIVKEMTIEECQRRVEEGIINVSVFRSYALAGVEQEVDAVINAVDDANGEVTRAQRAQKGNRLGSAAVLSILVSQNIDLFRNINFVRSIRPSLQVFSRELARGYYVAPDFSNVQGYGRTDHGYLALLIASKI